MICCQTLYYYFRSPEMVDLYNDHKLTTKLDIWVCKLQFISALGQRWRIDVYSIQ